MLALLLSACATNNALNFGTSPSNYKFVMPEEEQGQIIQDTFRAIQMRPGYIDLTVLFNRYTQKGDHPPGEFVKKGMRFYAHSYDDAFGDAKNFIVVPSTIPTKQWQQRHQATFRFKNNKPADSSFLVGVVISTQPGGVDTPNTKWMIHEWACQPRGEINKTVFKNGKGDWKIIFKVSNGQLSTAIEEAYDAGWKLAEHDSDWPGCITSKKAVFYDSSGVPQSPNQTSVQTQNPQDPIMAF